MSVGTCRHCQETIIQRPTENYYVHTRTGMAQCGIRYATPVNPTADETKDIDQWTRLDLDAFWEGLNGIKPIGTMSEISASATSDVMLTNECDHLLANKAGAGYRENPVEVCVKCEAEL
jgi:hypothetical protein